MLSYYTDNAFCILLQFHVYEKATDMGANHVVPIPVTFSYLPFFARSRFLIHIQFVAQPPRKTETSDEAVN